MNESDHRVSFLNLLRLTGALQALSQRCFPLPAVSTWGWEQFSWGDTWGFSWWLSAKHLLWLLFSVTSSPSKKWNCYISLALWCDISWCWWGWYHSKQDKTKEVAWYQYQQWRDTIATCRCRMANIRGFQGTLQTLRKHILCSPNVRRRAFSSSAFIEQQINFIFCHDSTLSTASNHSQD